MNDPTRLTIWLVLICAFTALVLRLRGAEDRGWWTAGCVAYLAHVVAAFEMHHHWSHAAAVAATAKQTAEVTGWSVGAGIWANHLFTVGWIADVIRRWRRDPAAKITDARIGAWEKAWLGAFLFIVFNATVVFESGPVRWLGLAGFATLAGLWRTRRARVTS